MQVKLGQVGGESFKRETEYMSKEEIGLSIKDTCGSLRVALKTSASTGRTAPGFW